MTQIYNWKEIRTVAGEIKRQPQRHDETAVSSAVAGNWRKQLKTKDALNEIEQLLWIITFGK